MRYEYWTKDSCSQIITFEINDNVIRNIEFHGGCRIRKPVAKSIPLCYSLKKKQHR